MSAEETWETGEALLWMQNVEHLYFLSLDERVPDGSLLAAVRGELPDIDWSRVDEAALRRWRAEEIDEQEDER